MATTYYTVNGGATQTVHAPFTVVAATGTQHVVYWSVDARRQRREANQHRLREHRHHGAGHHGERPADQPPTAAGPRPAQLGHPDPERRRWARGVATTYYTSTAAPTQTYGTPFTVSGDRHATPSSTGRSTPPATSRGHQHRLREHRHHGAGHHGERPADQPPTPAGRTRASRSRLTPSDALSGVATTYYMRRTAAPSQTYTTLVQPSPPPARNTVVYWSVDAAGNTESPQHRLREHRHHGADRHRQRRQPLAQRRRHRHVSRRPTPAAPAWQAPSTACRAPRPGSTATGNAFIVPAPSDGSNDGAHVYEYQALDNAGNASATGTCTVKIDTQGPVVTPTGLAADQYLPAGDHQPDGHPCGHRRRLGRRPRSTTRSTAASTQTYSGSAFTVSRQRPARDRLLGDRRPGQRDRAEDRLREHLQPVRAGHEPCGRHPLRLAQRRHHGDHHRRRRQRSVHHLLQGRRRQPPGRPSPARRASTFSTAGQPHRRLLRQEQRGHVSSVYETGYCNIDLTKPVDHGHRPAGQRDHRLADHARQTGDAHPTDAGGSGVASTTTRSTAASPAPYTGTRSLISAQRLAHGDLLLDRRRRQRRDHAHRLREHRHPGADHDRDRPAADDHTRLGRRTRRRSRDA